ncbi:disease resistance protein [Sesbania bispinosa]|nr:disease resistance protein [Sesbania bispinosa]
MEGYEGLSKRAVAYAGGIPLALDVLGSHLLSRNAEFWDSELSYLENNEESLGEIQKVLQFGTKNLALAWLKGIEEVHDVLRNNMGTYAIEGITMDLSQKVDLHLRADTFNMMTKLRFLRLYVPLGKKRSGVVYCPTTPMPLPDTLRYFEWNGYPFKSLPPSFCAKLLVEIRLPHSDVEYLGMNGKEKYISFKNGMMMKLGGPSLERIMEDGILLTMKSAAFHNILVRKYSLQTHSYNYNSAEVCLPGSRVPRQFKYRTTDSSITIGLPDLSFSLGFILSVVVSPSSHGMKKHEHDNNDAKIQCQCYSKGRICVYMAS